MGQYWEIVNLDKLERFPFCGKLGEWIFNEHSGVLDNFLIHKPADYEFVDFFLPASKTNRYDSLRMTGSQSCDLGHLPRELIDLIFSHLDNNVDIICLGLTCRFMWEFCRQHMRIRIVESINQSSWARDRIICVGDYIEAGDEPKGVLTKQEEQKLKESEANLSTQDYAEKTIFKFHKSISNPVYKRLPVVEYYTFLSLTVSYGEFPGRPMYRPVVLRNISRHEYVREETVDALNRKFDVDRISFGHIITAHICWSSYDSIAMCYEGDIHRGKWAGDRFDITEADSVKDASVWKDVSVEVMEMVETIWRSQFDT